MESKLKILEKKSEIIDQTLSILNFLFCPQLRQKLASGEFKLSQFGQVFEEFVIFIIHKRMYIEYTQKQKVFEIFMNK